MSYHTSLTDNFDKTNQAIQILAKSLGQINQSVFESFSEGSIVRLNPIERNYSDDVILEHQLSKIEEIQDLHAFIKNENFLALAGYDSIQLSESGKYLETITLLNEGVVDTISNFLKSVYQDPDPTKQTLNILQLVLGVIGIIPFSWVAFPVDIVANVLNGLISIFREDYFSAILSMLSAVDVSKATAVTSKLLGPFAKFINPVLKIIFRSGKDAKQLETGVVALSSAVKKLGNKTVAETISWIFKSSVNFFTNTFTQIIRLVTKFLDTAIGMVPGAKTLGYSKNLTKSLDNLVQNASIWGKQFDTASKIFSDNIGDMSRIGKGVEKKAAGDILSGSVKSDATAAAIAAGKTGAEINTAVLKAEADHLAKFSGLKPEKYLDDLTKAAKKDPAFKKEIANLSKEKRAIAIKAKVENEWISSVVKSYDDALKADPKLVKYLSETYGIVPKGNSLVKLAKAGDVQSLRTAFEIIKDPKVSKHLTKSQVRAITPFLGKNGSQAFISGVKKFDGSVEVLNALTKAGGFYGQRAAQFRAFLSFLTRLVWQKYGSFDCILKAAEQNSKDLILGTSSLTNPTAPAKTNEAEEVSDQTEPATESTPTIDAEIKKNEENQKTLSANNKKDCTFVAAAVKATVGSHVVDFPGSTANLGGTPNMADDPKQAEEFQKNSTEYTKQILKSMGLGSTIDVQHAVDYSHPLNRLYFADVWDENSGVVSPNLSEKSRMDDVAKKMLEDGQLTQEEVEALQKQAEEHIKSGTIPGSVQKMQNEPTNESFFEVKGLF
jgi:hypothetical protein